ncbi:MAG TPA: translation initiation factor IF-2 [Candidatus Enterousia avicola]|uniref:Translation initiation factor IF-2 n=1 Tax=Candidatus Enterousia avicola TaxID=2840787 RepID=A0A9D1MS58_9PROT|nr:translation initiation factor IF-2 [Candidatus Enterousia avicola]
MATLTLGKSVTIDAVQSKKGDSVFVERRRRVVAPGSKELREEPKAPATPKNAADEKLRAVLAAAKAREEERQKRAAEEAAQRAAREAEIARENKEYEQVKEQLAARENVATEETQEAPAEKNTSSPKKQFSSSSQKSRQNRDDEDADMMKPSKYANSKKEFKKTGKISLHDIVIGGDGDDDDEIGLRGANRRRSEASLKRFREKARAVFTAPQKVEHVVTLGDTITVKDLAAAMAEKVGNVIKKLMDMGMMVSQNQSIDADTAELIAGEFGAKVKRVDVKPYADQLERQPDPAHLQSRPPVVTVVGHVDHGKTSLLDAFRHANVAAREAGGITQHISAYEVKTKSGAMITFLDTPGHETFTAMRARGAQIADIVVLVVAANDSIMPQTIEAINHIRAAKVPFIVAINKIDLPDADPQRVKTDLLQQEVQVEELGGDVQCVEISATKHIGLEKLEEAILLQAGIMDLKADPDMPAVAYVVEAKMERGLGATATVLMRQGTLKIGEVFVVGETFGRVRGLINSAGERVKSVKPGQPAVVLGLNAVPSAGDELHVMETEAQTREVANYRVQKAKDKANAVKRSSLQELFAKRDANKKLILPIVLRADVQGSVEAISDMLKEINTDKVGVEVLSSGVGQITEGDIRLAAASGAIVVAFNVRADSMVRDMARASGVDIRYHSVVYRITDEIKEILSGKLAPERKENFIGYADVIQLFTVGKGIRVAGCRVSEGVIKKDAFVRLLRNNIVIYDGKIGELRREKNEVKEVSGAGVEFGMSFDKYNDLKEGDRVECYEVEEVRAKL